MLDEPGNDLDTDMLAVMEDLLDSWPGTLLVVSDLRAMVTGANIFVDLTEHLNIEDTVALEGCPRQGEEGGQRGVRRLNSARCHRVLNIQLLVARAEDPLCIT